jgi:hypothetical protein
MEGASGTVVLPRTKFRLPFAFSVGLRLCGDAGLLIAFEAHVFKLARAFDLQCHRVSRFQLLEGAA